MGGDDDADGTIHAREFFDGSYIFDVAHAGATIFGRKNRSQQAELAQFFNGGERKFAGFVPLHNVRKDFALGKFANAFLEVQLFVVQLEVQEASSVAVAWSIFPTGKRKEGQLFDLNMMEESGKVTGGAVRSECGTPHVYWRYECLKKDDQPTDWS